MLKNRSRRFAVLVAGAAPACALLMSSVWAACGGEITPGKPPAPPTASSSAAAVAPSESVAQPATMPPAPPAPPVQFVEGSHAPSPDKAPAMKIVQPVADQILDRDKAGDFEVKLDLKGWETGVGGNHVHLILDNRPYKRIDDPKQPIKLKDIDPNYTLSEGQHVLVAFPSRHTHESVKPVRKQAPLAVVSFFIGKKGEVKWKSTDPTLIYSRPKGANNGAPPDDGILIDYYLANAELGDGKFSIEATLTGPGLESGSKVTIKDWKPWRIKHPRTGTYSLHMVLLGKDGKPVAGAWNDTTREFQVDLNAPGDASHAAHSAPAAAASASAGHSHGGGAPKK